MSGQSEATGTAAPERHDAVVVGGGIAGLAAAWELVQQGLKPLLVEARGYTGGLVASGAVAGVPMDLGAEGFVLRGTAVSEIAQAGGLQITAPAGGGACLYLPPLGAGPWALHRFPADAFLGIPASPMAADVVSVIGQAAACHAATDGELGGLVGTCPQDPADLASFIRARMGEAVLDRLVRPIVAGIHTADPADLAADTVAPGLRSATRRLGSLQAAVSELLAQRRARTGGRSVDVTTVGGLSRLTQSMREAIEAAGGQLRTRTGAQQLRRLSRDSASLTDGVGGLDAHPARWELVFTPTGPGATPSAEPVPTGAAQLVHTPLVVLACSAGAAQRLLAGAGVEAALSVPEGSPIARFILVAHAPELDSAPVGSGLLVAPVPQGTAPVAAKALSHLSVKWPWVGAELRRLHGPHTHALRLSYGRPGEPRPEVTLAGALADVAALTGVCIPTERVLEHRLVRWDGTLPPVSADYRAKAAQLVARVESQAGLGLTGAWVAGTGIASVVTHARAQAARLAGNLKEAAIPRPAGANGGTYASRPGTAVSSTANPTAPTAASEAACSGWADGVEEERL
ncbi:Protoporphyrinogen oxidase [Actinomyces bovis]|uniref:Protoporphyrinogen oxidase n=1 Tax=Actinomyces bovis TaxID=1658 RepID=A0ABY1VR46_9ACTO|nr:FAD-dependent oxidoreductase [Actinomyces bovis]SPT54308.1 Protoporphyrinogen oxidase [Actinomyces bovis]VEG56337.1 Protoporphyrinogen oxidase [Actinomyces israelii]